MQLQPTAAGACRPNLADVAETCGGEMNCMSADCAHRDEVERLGLVSRSYSPVIAISNGNFRCHSEPCMAGQGPVPQIHSMG